MKKGIVSIPGAAIVLLTTLVLTASAFQTWSFLGERGVTDKKDHDTIAVTAGRGTFTAIKLGVRGRAVQFHKVVVHFATGADFEVELRDTIAAGAESRVINLPGGRRNMKSIDFWYDAKSAVGGQAQVRVFGRL